ncbi:hypothetical protein AB0H06_31310, partial [Streptomyces althioticus]|uniref:hypothetical protein n=1 Tax=Streptomyces althioticus TaxID=83380 RepID=UPI0033D86D87
APAGARCHQWPGGGASVGRGGAARAPPQAPPPRLEARVREGYLAVDTVVHHGGRQGSVLLIGVE